MYDGWGVDTHEDDLKEHFLVDLHEFLVPLLNVCGALAAVRILLSGGGRVFLVVVAPFEDFAENGLSDLERLDSCRR